MKILIFLLSYSVILVCNLHVNAGILHCYFSILWVTSANCQAILAYRSLKFNKMEAKNPTTTACTKDFSVLLCTTKLAQTTSQYYFVLQSLHKVLPSTTLYYKACTKHFPVLLVLQSLHKLLPSTTLYYKACTKHVPVLLCTTKLAQSTSQYYFVLQSLHKARSSTTFYHKACTNHFPVLLCTTKLAQSTFQYYFLPQSLHKPLPSTTLYYKACTKHFPVLLCTTKLAQSTSQYYFVLQTDMTTCLETFEKEKFCSFPQRHGDATGKPET